MHMLAPSQRALLFWLACIPVRLYAATLGDNTPLRLAAALMSFRWIRGMKSHQVGFFGGPAWWADEREAHGALWGAYALTGEQVFLYADVLAGAVNWIAH